MRRPSLCLPFPHLPLVLPDPLLPLLYSPCYTPPPPPSVRMCGVLLCVPLWVDCCVCLFHLSLSAPSALRLLFRFAVRGNSAGSLTTLSKRLIVMSCRAPRAIFVCGCPRKKRGDCGRVSTRTISRNNHADLGNNRRLFPLARWTVQGRQAGSLARDTTTTEGTAEAHQDRGAGVS